MIQLAEVEAFFRKSSSGPHHFEKAAFLFQFLASAWN